MCANRLLGITGVRLGLGTRNLSSSLRLLRCLFAPNFETKGLVTLVLGPEDLLESLA